MSFFDKPLNNEGFSFGQHYFRDSAGYNRSLQELFGIESRSMQISPGSEQVRLDYFACPGEGISAGRTRMPQAEFIEFIVPAGHTLVSICCERKPYFCNGVRVNPVAASLYPGGYAYSGVYPEGWDAIDLLLDNRMIRERQLLRLDLTTATSNLELRVAETCGDALADVAGQLRETFSTAAEADSGDVRRLLARLIVELVTHRLGPAVEAEFPRSSTDNTRKTRRADVLQEAVEYIRRNVDKKFSAEEMAESLGVKYRIMHYAFREAFGVSPYKFILINKLNAVRDDIRLSDQSVREICYSYGFDTPSRFRAQYRRLFGELPSETRELH